MSKMFSYMRCFLCAFVLCFGVCSHRCHFYRIHCTYMGGYTSQEVTGLACQRNMYDEIKLGGLKVEDASPGVLGRFYIEVRLSNVIAVII